MPVEENTSLALLRPKQSPTLGSVLSPEQAGRYGGMASDALSGAYATWKAGAPVAAPSMKEAGGRMAVNLASMLGITPEVTGAYRAAGGDVMNPAFRTAQLKGMMGAIPLGGMTVYHGSPHVFDKFKLDKIGTGEGAQAYGHGMYFAENPKVAGQYAENLAGKNVVVNRAASAEANAQINSVFKQTDFNGPKDIEAGWLKEVARQTVEGGDPALAKEIAGLNPADFVANKGSLYHVDIPDDDIAKMLDWDKPLSEQPESVRKALGYLKLPDYAKGSQIYDALKNRAMSAAEQPRNGLETYAQDASFELASLGIPGIKYFDGTSRKAGKGTRNLVLFDENLAKILKRE